MAEARVVLKADDRSGGAWASFLGNASKAEAQLNRTAGATALFAKASGALAVGLSAGVFAHRISETINYADELNKLSQRTGIAASTLSQWQYAAGLANVSNESLTKGLRELNKSIAEAIAGDKAKVASFKNLGITTDDLGKGTEAVMFKMADAYAKAKDGSGKLTNAAGLLGAKVGDELIPLLNQGSEAIKGLKGEAEKLGITISDDFAAQAEEFNDNLTRLKKSSDALYVSLASDLVKGLGDSAKAAADAAVEHGKLAGILAGVQTLLTGTDRYKNDKATVELTERKLRLEQQLARMEANRATRQPNEAVIERTRAELDEVNGELKSTLAYRKLLDEDDARQKAAADARKKAKEEGEIKVTGTGAEAAFNRGIDAQIEALKAKSKVTQDLAKRDVDVLESEYKRGIKNEQQFVSDAAQVEINALGAQRAGLVAQLALVQQKSDSEKEAASVRGQIAEVDAKLVSRGVKYENDFLEVLYRRTRATEEAAAAQQEEANQERSAAELEADKRYRAIEESVRDYGRAIEESNQQTAFELTLMGKTDRARAVAIEQRRVEIALREQERKIDEADITADQKTEQKIKARASAASAIAAAEGKATLEEWKKTDDAINSSLTDALLRGFEKGKDAAENLRDTIVNMFKTLVLRPIIQAVMAPVSGAMSSFTNGIVGGVTGGGAGGGGGLIGNIGSSIGQQYVGNAISSNVGGFMASGFAQDAGIATAYNAAGFGAGASAFGMGGVSAGMSGAAEAVAMEATLGSAGGAAAGGMGASGALAAMGPWGWAALAGMAIVGSGVLKGGETRSGGQYNGTTYTQGPSGGQINAGGVQQGIEGSQAAINYALKELGSSQQLQGFVSGLESSKNGKGFAYAGGTLSGGATFGQGTDGAGYMNRRGSKDEAQAYAEFTEELKQATLQALQASDIKGSIAQYIRDLGNIDALTGSALDEAYNKVQAELTRRAATRQERMVLEARLLDLTSTDLERLNRQRAAERNAVDETNRSLVDQIHAQEDVAIAEGKLTGLAQTLRAAYEDERQQRQASIDSLRGAAKALREYRSSLLLSDDSILSLPDRRDEAARQFGDTLAAARSGDVEALGNLRGASDKLLEAIKATAATREDYMLGAAGVMSDVTSAATGADAKATVEEQQLATMKEQLDALHLLDDNLKTFADALAAYQAGQAAVDAAKASAASAAAQVAADRAAQETADNAAPTPVDPGKLVATKPLDAFNLKDWLSGLQVEPSGGFATGGAFLGDGVVMRPTNFDVAQMAENGPEAILPLVNVGGSLGVRAIGAGGGSGDSAAILQDILAELRSLRGDTRIGHVAMTARLTGIDDRLKKTDLVGPEYLVA